jgi:ubiquinone biosynthesis protein
MRLFADLRRLAHRLRVSARHGAAEMAARRFPRLARRIPLAQVPGPQRFRTFLEELGGTFIKFGQILALQPDILSVEQCDALFDLLDRVPPFDFADVDRTFREELGGGVAELCDSFSTEPMASASIGQVHVARVEGRDLAIKVQRPTTDRDFARDIAMMRVAARLIEGLRITSLHWLLEPMTEFIRWTEEELDYRVEARYMELLGRQSRDNPRQRVPEVYSPQTTRRLLAAELLEGPTLLDYVRSLETPSPELEASLARAGFEPVVFAANIIDNFLSDAFRSGLFHADLHPANLLILPDNVVGYVDFGITGQISRYSRRRLVDMTLALVRGDLDTLCSEFFRISRTEPGADRAAFRSLIDEMAEQWFEIRDGQFRMKRSFTVVMLEMARLSRRTGIHPQREVLKYIRSVITADGLIKRFAPEFDVDEHVEQYCRRYLRQLALDSALSFDRFLDAADASIRLLQDGLPRFAEALDQVGRTQESGSPDDPARGPRAQALQLSALILVLSLLLGIGERGIELGAGLTAAGLAVLAAALAVLLWTIRRWLDLLE